VFRGTYEHAIDAKGRTSLPSRFREVLTGLGDSRLILTTGLDGCVVAYPLTAWAAFEAKLMALPQFEKAVRQLRRLYIGGAIECEIDSVGRMLIPQSLRSHAELRRDAIWMGMGPHLELWDKERYATMHQDLNDEPTREVMERRLAELGL